MRISWKARLLVWLLCTLFLASCTPHDSTHSSPRILLPVRASSQPLEEPARCTGRFVLHELEHMTLAGEVTRLFESNGAGVAINDLDNDGDLDVVLANLHGDNSILWNDGDLHFHRESLPYNNSRAVAIVDVEGDGWADLLLTSGNSAPRRWRNLGPDAEGQVRFRFVPLPGVYEPAYALNWADLEGDGDLDMVTASYDAALMLEMGNAFLFGRKGGVYLYEQEDAGFQAVELAEEAQALALGLADFTGDGRPDIAVGNDFDLPDFYWQRVEDEWRPVRPFASTAHSTMSFDWGDIDNDGRIEWLATDMKPYQRDVSTLAAWLPLMEKGYHTPRGLLRPQIRENVLLVAEQPGRYRNEGYGRGLDATGWSWSGKFGDLDNDGYLDVYVVNGMIAEDLLAHLPDGELTEENQARRNDGTGRFHPAPEWGLAGTASGRGMSFADLDTDGDLDIVVNNLNAPAELWENRLCGGEGLEVDLIWPGSQNVRAVGARLVLHTELGEMSRDVRVMSGYLSGDPARIHFGFPAGTGLQRLEIFWPDGQRSDIAGLNSHTLLTVTR